MRCHFQYIQGNKYSYRTLRYCYSKRWHHSCRCCLHTRQCLKRKLTVSIEVTSIGAECTLILVRKINYTGFPLIKTEDIPTSFINKVLPDNYSSVLESHKDFSPRHHIHCITFLKHTLPHIFYVLCSFKKAKFCYANKNVLYICRGDSKAESTR